MATAENLRPTPARMAGAGLYVRTHECGLFFLLLRRKNYIVSSHVRLCVCVCLRANSV